MVKFLQLKTILPIYAPDGRYIEAWQALYELSLPLAPAQDSLPRPPRVLLEGEYLSLELRGNYLAKAVFAHLPVQARRGSDLFAERFAQPTAMLFKRVNGRFLAPFFMGENGASPACKEAVGVDSIGLMRAKSALPEPTACTKMIVVEPQTLKHPSQEEPKGSAVIQINAEYRLVTRSEGNVYYYPKFIPSIFSGSMRKGDCKLFMSQLPSSNRRPTILDEEPKADNVPYYEVQINFKYGLAVPQKPISQKELQKELRKNPEFRPEPEGPHYSLLDLIRWQAECPCSRGIILDYDLIRPNTDIIDEIKAKFLEDIRDSEARKKWRAENILIRDKICDKLVVVIYEQLLDEFLENNPANEYLFLSKYELIASVFERLIERLKVKLKEKEPTREIRIIQALEGIDESKIFYIDQNLNKKPVMTRLLALAEAIFMAAQSFSQGDYEVKSSHDYAAGFNTYAALTYFGRHEENKEVRLVNSKIILTRGKIKDENYPTGILVHEAGHNAAIEFYHNNPEYGYTRIGLQSSNVMDISPSLYNVKKILEDALNRLSMDSW